VPDFNARGYETAVGSPGTGPHDNIICGIGWAHRYKDGIG
jgi:hypothetical protein